MCWEQSEQGGEGGCQGREVIGQGRDEEGRSSRTAGRKFGF